MRATSTLFAAVLGVAMIAIVAPAHADDVSGWISLIEKQPTGVDRASWKEQRRDAARKLAAAKDRRALTVFLQLAENETFDIIGEIAIEGLGALGEPGAIPTLQRIADDASRDRTQRELARKALTRLGAKAGRPPVTTPTPPVTTPTPPVTTTPTPPVTTTPTPPVTTTTPTGGAAAATTTTEPVTGLGDALLGAPATTLPTDAPVWGDDVLAASESLTFAAGVASLSYDSVRERMAFDLDAAGRYRRRLEREGMAWGVDADARIIAARQAVTTDQAMGLEATSRAVIVDLDVAGDIRFYGGPRFYGVGAAAISTDVQYLAVVPDTETPYRDVRFAADVQIGLGGGYGRVLDVGTRLRLRQVEALLRRARALGRPIDDEVARKLQATWWALRRDRTGFRQLAATVTVLREAGVLLGEPLSVTTYELLEALRDPSFDDRADGYDVQLMFGEGYVVRPDPNPDDDVSANQRVEMVLLRGRLARNLGLDSDVHGRLDASYRILAPDDVAAPWRLALGGGWRRFVHGDHGELLGGLDVGGELVMSDDGLPTEVDDRDVGMALGATVGWSATFNRASRIRVGADARVESGELFFGVSLTASYGWLDAAFARSLPAGL